MEKCEIKNRCNGKVIFESKTTHIKSCAEAAIKAKANLWDADLRGADLRGVNLSRGDLCGADLSGADLSGAYLFGADLCSVNLCDANLSGANLRSADLCGVRIKKHQKQMIIEALNIKIND